MRPFTRFESSAGHELPVIFKFYWELQFATALQGWARPSKSQCRGFDPARASIEFLSLTHYFSHHLSLTHFSQDLPAA